MLNEIMQIESNSLLHKYPLLTSLRKRNFENIVGKKEKMHFLLFPTMFTTYLKTKTFITIWKYLIFVSKFIDLGRFW